jgi:hypothetical protein
MRGKKYMKSIALAAIFFLAAASAQAASCKAEASGKKLAGAALNSFMKKCENDAKATCDASASDRKLSGAAKTSFTKKCVNDAVNAM